MQCESADWIVVAHDKSSGWFLFTYVLFNEAVSSSYCIASNYRIINV
jgi:hypothetical protein